MATTSRLKAIKTQMRALLTAHAGLTGVPVDWQHPGEHMEREHIWFSRAAWSEEPAQLGTSFKRDQEISVTVVVRVEQEGDAAQTLDERAADLANAVEEALRANPNLNNEVIHGGISGGEHDSFIEDGARVSAIRLTCTYLARKGA